MGPYPWDPNISMIYPICTLKGPLTRSKAHIRGPYLEPLKIGLPVVNGYAISASAGCAIPLKSGLEFYNLRSFGSGSVRLRGFGVLE